MHRERAPTPLARLLDSPDASRPGPGGDGLTAAFRITVERTLRRSDATVSVEGVRDPVPAPGRHLRELHLRGARWDDARHDQRLCTLCPFDKRAHAGGLRQRTDPGGHHDGGTAPASPRRRRCASASSTTRPPPQWRPIATERPGPGTDDDEHADPSCTASG